ncbi:SMC-Scp complex subunit ScpB [Lactobacillus sp. S2-2]|uniref:SMC-Scp complex subunit ScpB n=1 Tax=Lactobacillus sp. S2-2 TaxID=2692917 RepID=UPI001F00B98B|nr:SMC-Scp complex subunit ScpB [Lactobacillus sp. S2-2]
MKIINNKNKIKVLLFVSGNNGIESKQIREILDISITELKELLNEISDDFIEDGAFCILQNGSKIKMVTQQKFDSFINDFFKNETNSTLSNASLETLSIIAYRQPITRIEIDTIRGVKSSMSVNKLLDQGFIYIDGESKEMGNPSTYATTDKFLDVFGLKTIENLPELKDNLD